MHAHTNRYPATLPRALRNEYDEGLKHDRTITNRNENHPRSGRPIRFRDPSPVPTLIADSIDDLNTTVGLYEESLGPKARGNKRLGSKALYADLIQTFIKLTTLDIALPSRSNLSAKAIYGGVGDLLRRHNYVEEGMSDDRLAKNTRLRAKFAASLNSQFNRARQVISKKPSL